MKKYLLLFAVLTLAIINGLLPMVGQMSANVKANAEQYAQIMARIQNWDDVVANMDIVPLTSQGEQITPRNAVVPSTWQPPIDHVVGYLYARGGTRLGFIPEVGLVVTEDGRPVHGEDNVGGHTGDVIIYDPETQEFIDGANRRLGIYLNSRVNRHYLRSGGRYLSAIRMDREVVLIQLNTRAGARYIYAFTEHYDRGWFNGLFGNRNGLRFLDMNGREININYIAEFRPQPWWRLALGFAFPVYGIAMVASGNHVVPIVEILNRTTLAELLHHISHATEHPWETLRCIETNEIVRTEDGRVVHLNPTTRQLTDFFGFALFNQNSGLPIVFHQNDIITTDRTPQNVESGILRDSMSVRQLLDTGADFYMATISTFFGIFDVPVFRRNTDPHNPDWGLMNGDDAHGIINDHRPTEVNDGESFGAWWSRVFGSGSGGLGFMQILGIALAIFIFILLLPVFVFVFKIGFSVIAIIPTPKPKPRKKAEVTE